MSWVGQHYRRTLDAVELGLADVIAGNYDYTFNAPNRDVEGLANALNTLIGRLLGRPPETDAEREPWERDAFFLEDVGAPPARPGEAAPAEVAQVRALLEEPEARYLRRVYDEFMAARAAAGLPLDGVGFEAFAAKLRKNEALLRARSGGRAVRFNVERKGSQVTLKPIRLE
jgi:hypothetical protein